MTKTAEIQQFLNDFHAKMGIWGIVFRDDRGKNTQTLLDLEITKAERYRMLTALKVSDYAEGPNKDTLNNGADMWVFGKTIKGKEVYIKITMGICNSQVICISFHVALYQMNYPYSNKE